MAKDRKAAIDEVADAALEALEEAVEAGVDVYRKWLRRKLALGKSGTHQFLTTIDERGQVKLVVRRKLPPFVPAEEDH